MPVDPQELHDELSEIHKLYVSLRLFLVLSEQLDPKNLTYLGPVNEIRNSFDHVMRAFDEEPSYQFGEAKEHIKRACYDTLDNLAIDTCTQIDDLMRQFDSQVISRIFPKYYESIRPQMLGIQREIAELRSNKSIDQDMYSKRDATALDEYFEIIKILIDYNREVTEQLNGLREEQEKVDSSQNSAKKEPWIRTIIVGVLLLLIGMILREVYEHLFV